MRSCPNRATPVREDAVVCRYWYMALDEDKSVVGASQVYRQNTGGAMEAKHNLQRFGVASLPASYGRGGKDVFVPNEAHTLYKRDFGGHVLRPGTPPARTTRLDGNWPPDASLSSSWTRADG